jgi:hypothetical protein
MTFGWWNNNFNRYCQLGANKRNGGGSQRWLRMQRTDLDQFGKAMQCDKALGELFAIERGA